VCNNGNNVSHSRDVLAKFEHFNPGDDAVDGQNASELTDPKCGVFEAARTSEKQAQRSVKRRRAMTHDTCLSSAIGNWMLRDSKMARNRAM
jgi:hypothetical protein